MGLIIMERLTHMATDEQIATLKADIGALISDYRQAVADAVAKAQAKSNDPAIDELDATVKAADAALHTAATAPDVAVPVTAPAP